MQSLKTALKSKLKNAERIAILGIGSDLRGDDAAGMLIAEQLEKSLKEAGPQEKIKVFLGGSAPENLTGEIKRFKPTNLVIIDSADLGQKAGVFKLISAKDVGGVSFSTHRLPVKMMAEYLNQSFNCETVIIAIQPKHIGFGSLPSPEIRESAERIFTALKEILKVN